MKKTSFIFTKRNYLILIVSLCLICAGFILMRGGGGETEFDFNPEIFANRRIIIAPIIIIIGYIGMVFSIFYHDRGN